MNYYGKTHVGKVRNENQDTLGYLEIPLRCIGKNALLACVCDGMGGAAAGSAASTLALDTFIKYVSRQVEAFGEDMSNPDNIPFEKILRDGVSSANKAVFTEALNKEECAGMGTTLVACLTLDELCYFVNVGDSRAYALYGKVLERATHDHSYVQSLIDDGSITEEQAQTHPERNVILRAVGVAPTVEADITRAEKRPDAILLCSDGLSNMVSDRALCETLLENTKSEKCAKALVDMANNEGGLDNVSALTIYF